MPNPAAERLNDDECQELSRWSALMSAELESAPEFLPSVFWRTMNATNVRMLTDDGLHQFKRTVSQNYYNWLIVHPFQRHFLHIALDWMKHPRLGPLLTRIEKHVEVRLSTSEGKITLSRRQRRLYALYVGCIWHRMLRLDRSGIAQQLAEPLCGNPIRIWYDSKLISQDLVNSILEVNLLNRVHGSRSRRKIAEFGAGSGRLAHAFASTHTCTYCIFDIPPALIVSQWYLRRIFPHRRIFTFRHFDTFEEVQDDVEASSIAFFTANQLTKFPKRYFDTIVSISTLPELTPGQARMFLRLFQSHSQGHIFLKQWKKWRNPMDGTTLTTSDYALDDPWRLIIDEDDPINPLFFNRVWTCDSM